MSDDLQSGPTLSGALDLSFAQHWPDENLGDAPIPLAPTGDGQAPYVFGSLDIPFDPDSSTNTSTIFSLSLSNADSVNPADLVRGSPAPTNATSPPSTGPGSASFPDSYLLPVNELTLLRAMLRIATRLGCDQSVWSLTAISPFNLGTATSADRLPATWRPTASQLLVPHHPLVDFLPWPNVRDRVLELMALPDEERPDNARGPTALVNLTYDMEDGAEGVRIWGGDPYDEKGWEVGQVFFERWWFVLDREVIDQSNGWRRLRGAPPLRLAGDAEEGAGFVEQLSA